MWRLASCVLLVFSTGPAFAEVCDKVRPNWDPSSEPVDQLQELYYIFSSPLGIILIALWVLVLFFKRTMLSVFAAFVLIAVSGLIAANWFWPDDGVTYGAHLEGCTGNPLATCLVLVVMAGMSFIGGKTRKS